ncbi:hypothetical protein O4H66_17355 [Comamonadaceae bacterium G21597-S1]|nr:hypothetical protein [Comamonadaceae bacterium G21597-S1]
MEADDFLADVPSADDFLGEPDARRPRRDRIRNPYVAPDNPANPIAPTGGSVLQDVQMAVPTFNEDRQNRALVNAAIEANTPAPRAPRPVRDAKAIAQDLYSILGNTGVQLVKPFVDVANIPAGGALDPAVRFLRHAGQAANQAASPTTQYDRETLASMPEGDSLEKAAFLISNPGLAASMGVPSVASMAMPLAAAKGASVLFPRTAAAMGEQFATGSAVGANALMNAGDTFGQTQADLPGRLLAALGSGAASALVGKFTGGGLEGQLARGGGMPTVGAALRSVGKESAQEFGENVGNQLAQDTGEGQPLNFAKAIDEGTIGAVLAPFVSGPINAAQLATDPGRHDARLLAGAIKADTDSMPARPDVIDNSVQSQAAPAATRPVTPATPAPIPSIPQLGYDPAVQNPDRPIVVDAQGQARPMSADEFLQSDQGRQDAQDTGLTPDVRRAAEKRASSPEPGPVSVPSDLVKRLIDSGWVPPDQRPKPSDGNNPNPDPDTVDAIGQDLESLYQQDVKDGIKRRLGIDQTAPAQPTEPKAQASAFRSFLRDLGIAPDLAGDITGERGFKANSRMPGTFRKGGLQLDEIVTRAVERGFLTDSQVESMLDNGGTNALVEMIRAELRGERQVSNDVAGDQAQLEIDGRAMEDLQRQAEAIGFDTAGMQSDQINLALKRIERRRAKAQGRLDVSREAQAERHAMDQADAFADLDDADIPWNNDSNTSTEDAMRALGFSDQEISDAVTQGPRQAQADSRGDGGTGQAVARGPSRADPADPGSATGPQPDQAQEGLTSYTPEELRARDKRIADQAKAQAQQQADADARAKADSERDGFALTGSDRAADVAASQGQADIFSEPAQPTQAPQPSARLTDAGDELIRNRRGKLKGLAWDDVSSMNDTLKVAQVIKSNVWPRPDYAKMVEDGAPAWKAAALKAVYDKIAAAPATRTTPTNDDLRYYIETLGQVRETLVAELDRVQAMPDADKLWKNLKAENVFGKVFPVPADARATYGRASPFDRSSEQGKANNKRALLIGGNGAMHALQFGYKTLNKIRDLVAEGFPAKREAWEKSYDVRSLETRDNDVPQAERTGEPQDRFYVYEKGSRYRLAKGGQDGGYATRELAEAFARSLTVKRREVLPPSRGLDLADVRRAGPDWRAGKNVTSDDVMQQFGFRGVNLGEYVKARQDIAQLHLNHVYDAFSDLADLLGVPPKAMSLNGTLGVAVGAQGSGKALAHFVPGVNEINITRDSGAGALAHEFGHALDHYFATQHGRAASMAKRPYLSAVIDSINDTGGVRPEVMGAMRDVMKAINQRQMTEAEARDYITSQREINQRRLDRWVVELKGNRGADPDALDAAAQKLRRGDVGEPQDTDLETNLADFVAASGLKPGNVTLSNPVTLAYRLRDLADEARFMATHIPQKESDYSKASAALDAKKRDGDGYWSTPWEKFARAFETFAMDALKDRQRESLYLSGLVDSKGWQEWSAATGKAMPYPAGEERLGLQQAFQSLVDTIQTRQDDAGNVAMYSRPAGEAANTTDNIRAALTERFGDLIARLEARGFLRIWDSAADYNESGQASEQIEGPAQGFWDGKQAHLFADALSKGDEVAVFLHEVGEHASMEDMIGPDAYQRMVARAYELVDAGDPAAVRAMDRVPDDTPAQYADSELLAYMIETVASDGAKATPGARKWLADVVAAVRAWFAQTGLNKLLERYGKGIVLTPQDIAALAVRAVRWQAGQHSPSAVAAAGKASRPGSTTLAAVAVANTFGGMPAAPTTAAQAQGRAMPWSVPEPGRLDDFIRYIQNNRIDIKRTVDAVKAAGQTIADDANPYLQDELFIGKVRAGLDRLADEQVTPLLRAIANSGFTPAQVNEYLWARHAEERNRQMAKVNAVPFTAALDLAGMSTADANTKLAAFQAMPDFRKMQAIARMVDQITSDARTKIVTDGLEEPGVIQAWEGAYKRYVPLQRDMEEAGGKASGYNVKGSESRRAVGSKKEAVNILANVIAQAEATIIRSEKAAVGRSVLDMARQHPNLDFWTVDTPPTEKAIDPRTGLVTNRVKANYKALDNVFTVKEAGVEHFVVFNESNPRAVQFARTLKGLDAANMGPVMETINKATRYLAAWVTSRNPLFWLTNFARDMQGLAFNLQSTPLAGQAPQVLAKVPQALAGVAMVNMGKGSGRWKTLAQEFKDSGGQTGYMQQYRDSVERMGDIVKEVNRIGQSRYDPRALARGLLDVIDGANDTIENGVRLAAYAQAREEGLSQAQAASLAKNITVNFNRKGNATALYNALFMFFNANVQGNVRMIQGVMQSRRAQAYAGALTVAGAAVALLNLAAGGDDEATRKKRYELVPEWERERNWIVFIPGTDEYIKIPLPLGPHVLFNAGRILAELGFEDGADPVEKAGSFVSSMISAFNPIGGGLPTADAKGVAQLATPTIARPIVDTVLNQNFAGIPITRENNFPGYKKPNYLNGRENTPAYWTTAAKAMNDWTGGDTIKPGKINLSPEQLAYLVKGYAVPGIAQTADKVAGQVMSRKDAPLDQIVGVSKFFGKIDDNERRRAAYEVLRTDEQRLGEYKNYVKAGEREKAREVLTQWGGGSEANGRKLLGQYTATDRLLASYRKQKKALTGDDDGDRLDAVNARIDRTLAVYLANTRDARRRVAAAQE